MAQASVAESSVALPPVKGERIMRTRKIPLKVVIAPAIGVVVEAPPVLVASEHSVDYICGRCAAVLLHADEGQVHGVLIHCTKCGSYNLTEA
jgi:DNA-directed RNA polymerase subunit RPC12/RpoP